MKKKNTPKWIEWIFEYHNIPHVFCKSQLNKEQKMAIVMVSDMDRLIDKGQVKVQFAEDGEPIFSLTELGEELMKLKKSKSTGAGGGI